MVLNDLVKY